ncbi:DUF1559 family PulG-like putative transporter [Limnoglobus roseus]|uniref:DUF1559 domain-containing protein n=1 Tax=Limnoglobus roseus TaxID=2598579 RepID=A0A5C1AGP1_9BACT|nr:DUF1559 domain-containing protein [Limnoglobus roseus]QEL16118.1 hypothetical protein PX52LOC_03057 [Limnoglobus roseus]
MFRIMVFVLATACGLAAGCKPKPEPQPEPQKQPEDNPKPQPDAPTPPAPDAAKETAKKRLKEVAAGWLNFTDGMGPNFPTNTAPKTGVGLSWRVVILPYIGQDAIYKKFKLDEPWDSEANKALIDQMPEVYASPGKAAEKGKTYLRSFVGPHAALPDKPLKVMGGVPRGRMFIFPDGTSNTITVAEATEPVIWTKADDLPFDGGPEKPTAAVPKLGGPFDGGFHAAAADGVVHWFEKSTPEAKIRAAITIDGNEMVPLPPVPPTPPASKPSSKPRPPASKR